MAKAKFVQEYINKCETILEDKDIKKADILQDDIIAVFEKEIPNICNRLDNYNHYCSDKPVDFLGDLSKLQQILTNHLADLEREDEIRKDELEKLKLKQSILNINNTNTNSANATATSTVTITIEQTIKNISQIPDTILSQSEKEELEDKISALEVAKINPTKLKNKLPGILKYIADKGVDVGVALLPYLGEIAKLI